MARSKRSAVLDTRNKRLSLEAGKRFIDPIQSGAYLVYQRPKNGASGMWHARWYDAPTRKQKQIRIGNADDFTDADGMSVLTYTQAQQHAEKWFKECARISALKASGEIVPDGAYTVGNALEDYLIDAEHRGMKGYLTTKQFANAHIIPAFGNTPVVKLTRRLIEEWHWGVATSPRRKTGRVREQAVYLPEPVTEEDKRRRKSTANRILTILKAVLNHAQEIGRIGEEAPWRRVKPFKGVTSSRVRFLSVGEQQLLVRHCDPEFRLMVEAALFTGARYGELTRLRVKDFIPLSGTVFIEFSKPGLSRHVVLTEEGVAWFTAHTAGRNGEELLLRRTQVKRLKKLTEQPESAWARYDQVGLMERAYKDSGISRVSFHELRHTYASALVNNGVPLAFVAQQLGHADIRMVQRHYGHLCPSALADAIRTLAPKLGIAEIPNIGPLRVKGA